MKQQLIEEYLAKPIAKGDRVFVKEPTNRNPDKEEIRFVVNVINDSVYYEDDHKDLVFTNKSNVRKDTSVIGADPFQEPIRAQVFNVEIWQLLFRMGWNVKRCGEAQLRMQNMPGHVDIPEVNYESTVEGPDGEDIVYQRPLVWTIVEKQLLIESIYNNIEIGKFVIRARSWSWVERRLKSNKLVNTAFADVVDGKQRINAIIDFIHNDYPDSHGNYWKDLSAQAKRKFTSYMKFSYLELDEHTDDKTVLKTFLAINFTGAPMSTEHIDYVKSIKL